MAYRIDIYIGSDNGSRKIGRDYLDKITHWASRVFPSGYTLTRGRGYYDGAHEESLVLSVLTDYNASLRDYLSELKGELGQKSILLSRYHVNVENV